jgi:hypothetical protein
VRLLGKCDCLCAGVGCMGVWVWVWVRGRMCERVCVCGGGGGICSCGCPCVFALRARARELTRPLTNTRSNSIHAQPREHADPRKDPVRHHVCCGHRSLRHVCGVAIRRVPRGSRASQCSQTNDVGCVGQKQGFQRRFSRTIRAMSVGYPKEKRVMDAQQHRIRARRPHHNNLTVLYTINKQISGVPGRSRAPCSLQYQQMNIRALI